MEGQNTGWWLLRAGGNGAGQKLLMDKGFYFGN